MVSVLRNMAGGAHRAASLLRVEGFSCREGALRDSEGPQKNNTPS
jgi:hypothetical protein